MGFVEVMGGGGGGGGGGTTNGDFFVKFLQFSKSKR